MSYESLIGDKLLCYSKSSMSTEAESINSIELDFISFSIYCFLEAKLTVCADISW